MKQTFGAILIGLGIFSIVVSSLNAREAPNMFFLIGTFFPGLLLLGFGLVLRREKMPQAPEHSAGDPQKLADPRKELQSSGFKRRATLALGVGIVMMFLGRGVAQRGFDSPLAGVAATLGGWALLIWGC